MRLYSAGALMLAMVVVGPLASQERVQQRKAQRGALAGRLTGAGQLRLLEIADVQKDLKLSEEQVKKITELSQKQKDALKDIKGRADAQKAREASETIRKALAEILNETQSKRLKQLELQQRGARALLETEVNQALGLNQEQKTKVEEAVRDSSRKSLEITRENRGNREAAQKKVGELTKSTLADVLKTLTPEQQTKWRELAGEPFQGTLPSSGFAVGRAPRSQ
jgi:hypothetical protein